MEFKKLIKYFFLCGSAYFTVLCSSLLVILALLTGESTNIGVEPSKFLLLLAFCFTMALGSTVRRVPALSGSIGWIINAALYLGGCLAFLLISGFKLETAMIITAAFACFYAPIAILIAFKDKKKRGKSILGGKKPAAANKNTASKASKSEDKKDNAPYQNLFS